MFKCEYLKYFPFVFVFFRNVGSLSVYLGKKAINETYADKEQSFTVDKLVIHEKYNDSNYDNDIGVHNCTVLD